MGAGDGAIFTRGTAQAGGFRIPYLQGGLQRDLEPVLYLHGFGGGGRWESFQMALGTVTLTIAPQLPGWAASAVPKGITSARDYAALMAQLLDTVGLDRVAVVGHSFGGWVAQHLATEHPTRVTRLALIDSLGLDVPDAPTAELGTLDEDAFAARAFGKLGLVATAQAYGFGAEWQNIRQGQEFERQWKGRGLVADLAAGRYGDPALTAAMQALRIPALVMWGRLDGIVPLRHAELLHRWVPGSSLRVLDRAGHLPIIEKPETANRLIRNFLLGIDEPLAEVSTEA
ncbi:MAG: alpha/beta hydrolase [Dehalococcoidia bacterium]|nr:alpha/beta hydrolase [Dehalococcoidia bacterium]